MANIIYPKYKEALLSGAANTSLDAAEGVTGVCVALVDTGVYTFSTAHEFYDDITGIVDGNQEILNKSVDNGIFVGDEVIFPTVSGDSVEAYVIYRKNAGATSTWPVVCFVDNGATGLPVTPDGRNIRISWSGSGIFAL